MSKAKKEILYKGITLDSQEEYEFILWLHDARSLGYFSKVIYHPQAYEITPKQTFVETITLKTKIKETVKTLLQPHIYQADFLLVPTQKFNDLRLGWHINRKGNIELNYIIVDVKGTFNQNDAHRRFSVDQKLVYDKYQVYVQKVIPQELFKKTWVPELCAFNKRTRERRKPYANCKLLKEVIN